MTYAEEFGLRVRQLRLRLNMSQAELAEASGYTSRVTITKIEQGIINVPQKKLVDLAKALKVNPVYLMGYSKDARPAAHDLSKRIPLVGAVACGMPITAESNVEEYIAVGNNIHADYALRCQGDSMIDARINDGDIVFVKQQDDVEDGEIAVVLIDDTATLKRVYKHLYSIELKPENRNYPRMEFSLEEYADRIKIQGKAVAFQSFIK